MSQNEDQEEENNLRETMRSEEIKHIERRRRLNLLSVISLLALLLGGSVYLMFVILNTNREIVRKAAMTAQYAYNAMAEVARLNRRSQSINDLTYIIRYYRPSIPDGTARRWATLIYDDAEKDRNIQAEKIGILFALESRYKANAVNPRSKATGLPQLLFRTARHAAAELKFPWTSDLRLIPEKAIPMGIFVYADYERMFNHQLSWMLAGYGGEDDLDVLLEKFNDGKNVPKKDMGYYNDWVKIRLEVEAKILRRRLILEGDDLGNAMSSEMWEKMNQSITNQ